LYNRFIGNIFYKEGYMEKQSEVDWVLDGVPKGSSAAGGVTVCPLLGAAAGSKLTVERFLQMLQENKGGGV
jgi:hypothetical protein